MAKASSGRRTAGDWSKLVAMWKRSGLSAPVFGAREGVSPRSLYWWRWKLGKVAAPKTVGLVPVTVIDDTEEVEALRCRWEIRFPDGMLVEMTGPNSVEGLEVALRMLRGGPE